MSLLFSDGGNGSAHLLWAEHPLPKEDEEAIRMVNIWEKIKGLQKLFAT